MKKPDRRRAGSTNEALIERIQRGVPERRRFRERRASGRLVADLPFEIEGYPKQPFLSTFDISSFGMSFQGGPTPPVGTRLKLRLFLPDRPGHPVALTAHVLGPLEYGTGARVLFLNTPVEVIRRIHRLLG